MTEKGSHFICYSIKDLLLCLTWAWCVGSLAFNERRINVSAQDGQQQSVRYGENRHCRIDAQQFRLGNCVYAIGRDHAVSNR